MPGLFLHSRPTRMSSRLDDSFARSKRDHRADLTFPFGTILRILPTIRVFHRSTKRIIEKRGSIKRLDTLLRFFSPRSGSFDVSPTRNVSRNDTLYNDCAALRCRDGKILTIKVKG